MKNNTVLCFTLYNDRDVDGSVINAFEYFYTCYEIDNNVRLLIITPYKSKDFYINFFNNKYNIDNNWVNNLDVDTPSNLIRYKFDNILLMNWAGNYLNNILFYKNILFLSNTDLSHKKIKKYYCEYKHLTPFNVDYINYKGKIRWDLFKKPSKLDNKTYINCPFKYITDKDINLNLISNNNIINNIKKINYINRVNLNTPFNFGLYDSMLYIQMKEKIDLKPRCFIECQFLNIPYEFIYNGNNDGSYYRYHESLSENLNDRLLTKNDILINDFLS